MIKIEFDLELEMELKAGQTDDLSALSQELAEWGGMRQGSLSKAARGYHLAQGAVPRECRALRMLTLPANSTIDQAIGAALEHALAHRQYHEELWARGERKARLQLLEAGALMREMLVLVGGAVPRKVTTLFRAALTHLEKQVARETDAEKVCYDANYLNSELVLTSWLVNSSWREHMDNKSRMRLMGLYKRFCDVMLDRAMAELRSVFSHPLDADHYQQQLARLQCNINAFLLLSSAYPETTVESFIAQWRAVEHGIKHLPASGVDSVLENTRRQEVEQTPYWLSSASV
ncbi:MAG: CHAD domain-containing protein [Symbiopectobacterium sp.]|uniref:CHAD domain-containing protein n=1 Tax=Symbiopectobacterium sp. TaxID=2952789 RepID=UPI003F3819B1